MTSNQRRNIIYSILLVAAVYAVWIYRNREAPAIPMMEINGNTMGTYYQIKYKDPQQRNWKASVDSLLVVFNQSLSTYIPDSELSRFNQGSRFTYESPFFHPILVQSQRVWEETEGVFDPTIGPLVNAYGFGPEGRNIPDEDEILSLLGRVGFDKIFFDEEAVCKLSEGIYLDFSANAKGYGIDVLGEFMESKGIEEYMVNIGGDLRTKGRNASGEYWSLGIEKPELGGESGEIVAIIKLDNASMATSGNYRNFYEENGQLYYHTIDPRTGKPAGGNILSSTVVAGNATDADAYATAFMVMGSERAIAFAERRPDLQVFFVYTLPNGQTATYHSSSMNIELITESL
jgi:thiamine biosynthesis lipoprotein